MKRIYWLTFAVFFAGLTSGSTSVFADQQQWLDLEANSTCQVSENCAQKRQEGFKLVVGQGVQGTRLKPMRLELTVEGNSYIHVIQNDSDKAYFIPTKSDSEYISFVKAACGVNAVADVDNAYCGAGISNISVRNWFCGDGYCEGGAMEDCGVNDMMGPNVNGNPSCSSDCGGVCPPICGDNICPDSPDEHCSNNDGIDDNSAPNPPGECLDDCLVCDCNSGYFDIVTQCDTVAECAACPGTCPACCGDGVIDPGEDCDQGNIGVQTCVGLNVGFTGGDLGCNNNTCTFDTSGCTNAVCTEEYCGDGLCNATETNCSCPRDCDVTSCGDGCCQPIEIGICEADCGLPPCVETPWIPGACQGGGCGDRQREETRVEGCGEDTSQCVADDSCCIPNWVPGNCQGGSCGNGQRQETDANCGNQPQCVGDANCIIGPVCSNGACEPGENCGNCAQDCGISATHHSDCSAGDRWYFDACNVRQAMRQSCGGNGCVNDVCQAAPVGQCNNNVKDDCLVGSSTPLQDSASHYKWRCDAPGGISPQCAKEKPKCPRVDNLGVFGCGIFPATYAGVSGVNAGCINGFSGEGCKSDCSAAAAWSPLYGSCVADPVYHWNLEANCSGLPTDPCCIPAGACLECTPGDVCANQGDRCARAFLTPGCQGTGFCSGQIYRCN